MQDKILGSRYELLELIGSGGMAIVYKAMDNLLNRYVAVKILREEFKENEEFIRRFNVESQAAASLSHQNIVQIYDVGEEDGIHYIVMELLEGETLKHYINERGGKLSVKEAINFSMQICRALEHAHSKHVVHRDIKPQNIILTENGKLKVADFGIARAANNSTMVNAGKNAVGSVHYLSPEQARGGYTDHRSDIYSLGVVMYELFTGKLPFDGEESVSIVLRHLQEEAPLPSEINPELPAGIEAIIVRCMKKEQRMRYNNATEILEDLVKVYQNPSINPRALYAARSESMKNIPRRSVQKKKTAPAKKKVVKKKSHKGLIATFIIIGVLLVTLFTYLLFLLFPDLNPAKKSTEVKIPDLVGLSYEDAVFFAEQASVGDVHFTLEQVSEEYSEKPKGTIISQTPEGDFNVKRSREIKVVVSKGPEVLELGEYTGKKIDDIREMLEEKGLKVKVKKESNDEYDEDIIFKQIPSKGKKMAEGDLVTLYVSKGRSNTLVPDVRGMTREKAIVALEDLDLAVGKIIEEANPDYAKGEVCRQSIVDKMVPVGTSVDLYISTGEKEKNPDEKSQTQSQAEVVTPEKTVSKTASVTLSNLPKKPNGETVTVKLVLDGVCVYESDINPSSGNSVVSFSVPAGTDASHGIDVYYDGAYRTTIDRVTVNG